VVENLTFAGALRVGEETMAVLGGGAKAHGEEESFRPAPRIVSGRDNDRCTLLIRLVAAICFSLQDAGVSGAGKKPRQEVHCRDGHSEAEKHPGKHTLRAAFTEGEGEPGHDNRNQGRAIVFVNAFCRRLTAFSQRDWPLTCANAADARIRDVEDPTETDRSQREADFFRKAFFIADEFLSDDASRAPHRDS
jgi:hypothetical protein